LLHPDELEDPLELNLAPAAPRLRAAERDGERPGSRGQQLELSRQPASVLEAAGLGLVDELAKVAEPLLDGLERLLDALARLVEEGLPGRVERLQGDAPDGLGQLLLERLEPRGCRGGGRTGVDDRAARGLELALAACELVAMGALPPLALGQPRT